MNQRRQCAENINLCRKRENPNLGVVLICRNLKMERLPSMTIQRSPKRLKVKTKES